MSGIGKVFERLKAQGDGAFIGYVTGGDPEPQIYAHDCRGANPRRRRHP